MRTKRIFEDWLRERWTTAWRTLEDGREPPPGVLAELVAAYTAPDRHYHDLRHVADCLREFETVRDLAARPAEVELAIWFHDAVYDTRAADNEERSADRAAEAVEGEAGERIRKLILATRHMAAPKGGDACLMVDIDLAILGASDDRFHAYEEAIRREYAWVPENIFRTKRAGILEGFLNRERIYYTPVLRERYEQAARRNLTASITRLRQR